MSESGDEILNELDKLADHFAGEIDEDERLSDGVPDELRSADLGFIQMSGVARPDDAGPAGGEEQSDTDPSRPLSFFEEGVADVDSRMAPDALESGSRASDEILPEESLDAPIKELRDIIAELRGAAEAQEPEDSGPPKPWADNQPLTETDQDQAVAPVNEQEETLPTDLDEAERLIHELQAQIPAMEEDADTLLVDEDSSEPGSIPQSEPPQAGSDESQDVAVPEGDAVWPDSPSPDAPEDVGSPDAVGSDDVSLLGDDSGNGTFSAADADMEGVDSVSPEAEPSAVLPEEEVGKGIDEGAASDATEQPAADDVAGAETDETPEAAAFEDVEPTVPDELEGAEIDETPEAVAFEDVEPEVSVEAGQSDDVELGEALEAISLQAEDGDASFLSAEATELSNEGEPVAIESDTSDPTDAEKRQADETLYAKPSIHRGRRRSGLKRNKSRRKFLRRVFLVIALAAVGAAGYFGYHFVKLQVTTPENLYDDAAAMMAHGDYRGAADAFGVFVSNHATHPLRPEAQFMAAYCRQAITPSTDSAATAALAEFERFIRDNPNADPAKLARAQIVIGMLHFRLGRAEQALDILSDPELVARDPKSRLAVLRTCAQAHARLGQHDQAIAAYQEAILEPMNRTPDKDHAALAGLYESLARNAANPEEAARYRQAAIDQWQALANALVTRPSDKNHAQKRISELAAQNEAISSEPDPAATERPAQPAAGDTGSGEGDAGEGQE